MVRVFVASGAIAGDQLVLTGPEARHLGGALRLRPKETLVAVTPDGIEHVCEVLSANPKTVLARVDESHPTRGEQRLRIRLCQSLHKGDQFDRIRAIAGGLGVQSTHPLYTILTVARPYRASLKTGDQR